MENQEIREISYHELVQNSLQIKAKNYRLVQICTTRTPEGFELSYSFAKEYEMLTLRFHILEDDEISSISTVFPPAFLYENEMKDLFGIKIKYIAIDYKGHFYDIKGKTPYEINSDEEGEK